MRRLLRLVALALAVTLLAAIQGAQCDEGHPQPAPTEFECRPYIEKALQGLANPEAPADVTEPNTPTADEEGTRQKRSTDETSSEESGESQQVETTASSEVPTDEKIPTTQEEGAAIVEEVIPAVEEAETTSEELPASEEPIAEEGASSEEQAPTGEGEVQASQEAESVEESEPAVEEVAPGTEDSELSAVEGEADDSGSSEESSIEVMQGDAPAGEEASNEAVESTESSEEAVQQAPAGEAAESTEQTTEESAEFTEKPAEETAEATEQPAEKTAEQLSEESAESTEQPAEESAESTEQPAEELAESTEQPAEETTEATEQLAEESAESTEQATQETAEATEQPAEESAESKEQPAEESAESTEQLAEETPEATEQPAEESAESTEQAVDMETTPEVTEAVEESAESVEQAVEGETNAEAVIESAESTESTEQVSEEQPVKTAESVEGTEQAVESSESTEQEAAGVESSEAAVEGEAVEAEAVQADALEPTEGEATEEAGSGEVEEASIEASETEPLETVQADEAEPTPEEELSFDVEIPENLRPRDHIAQILRLDEDSIEDELLVGKTVDSTLKDLKRFYDTAIKPLEILFKYRDLSNRHFGDPEIFSKPLILFMGPWSGGKSSIINYLLDNEYKRSSLRTGAEPSPAYFNILMHGEREEVLDGTQLAADWTFSGLQKFGQGLLDRLRGLRLNNRLLEKVNIVEIPGILEIRKQVERLFPFNDACQWFIDRADIIFLVYDPAKLDVGPETEAILDQLKGREYQTRIVLNKADQVRPEELMRVQGTLIWNISPLMSSTQPPVMYSTSLWSMPYELGAPLRLLRAQERAFLRDMREAIDRRVENKIASARRFAVRVRNHAKMVDCYLTTYYNHKSFFGNRKKVADDITEKPQDYHIYEGLSTLTNISRYDLPDPETYRDFFKVNPLYEFELLSATCTYFKGCPINRLDVAIAYDLPELVGKYKKAAEKALETHRKS